MDKCPPSVYQGKLEAGGGPSEGCPLLMQMRLFHEGSVYKGVFLLHLKLPPRTILVRESMRKVKRDPKIQSLTFNSLEICGTSRKPHDAKLFQHLVLLLVLGGVPEHVFLDWAKQRLEDLLHSFTDKRKAYKVLGPYINERRDCQLAFRLIMAGMNIDEPFIRKALLDLQASQFSELIRERAVVAPEVLVYKPPGLHPGDIRRFEVLESPPSLKKIIGSAKYGIFFSVHAMRPPVDEMANADLDGDEFWICERKEVSYVLCSLRKKSVPSWAFVRTWCLIWKWLCSLGHLFVCGALFGSVILDTYKVSPPWEVPMKEPGEPKPREAPADLEAFEAEHWQMFLDAFIRPDYTKGQAANAWLASMDKHIVCIKDGAAFSPYLEKCLKLVDIYFKALDAEKTGVKVKGISQDLKEVKRPHFMVEPGSQQSGDTYVSNSILGQVYDLVKDPSKSGFLPTEFPIELDQKFEVEGFKEFWGKWSDLLMSYNEEMRHILSGEPDLRDKKCEELTLEYRQILYGGPDLINATKDFDLIKKEASAIYGVVYTRAKVHENNDWKGASLRFAWTVAGDALLEILRRPGWWTVDPTVMPELVARLAAA